MYRVPNIIIEASRNLRKNMTNSEEEKLLNNLGIKVIRIKNEDIFNNINGVLNIIKDFI